MLEVRLLGQCEARQDGVVVVIPSRASQSLFAYLLLTAGTMHRREKLAGLLWPDTTDENARKNLRNELWRLRKATETKTPRQREVDYFLVDEISIAFNAESDYWLDVAIVQNALAKRVSADDLIETLSLYHGELLPGLYDEWVVLERERIRAVVEQELTRLLDLLVEEKRWQDALDWGERWIALGQTPEPAYRALMIAHHALGDISQVVSTFGRCRRAMSDDLGVEPSHETQVLFERLSKPEKTTAAQITDVPGFPPPTNTTPETPTPPIAAAIPSLLRYPRPLPIPLTSFVGREREIVEAKQLLSTARLLTLVGAGGVGKTRLAIQLATELCSQFKDGACWVALGALGDPALVPQAAIKALGVREEPNVPVTETLAEGLLSSQILLVLDSCEHLIAACAQLAEFLLTACRSLKILATSREPLRISGETIWRVPSLSLPGPEAIPRLENLSRSESVRLFVERARAVKTDFSLTEENASPLVQICQRLDGIPLALELAAARVNTLSADRIAARLDDRFHLLTRGSRTALPRHQTLRATTDWSHDLLSESEKVLFRRLGIFAGGWTLEAAEFVCAGEGLEQEEVFDLLSRLVDKSLVIAEEQAGAVRYRMLETIRQYANEKLVEAGQVDSAYRRHMQFFVKLVEECERNLLDAEVGAQQTVLFDRLELEIDNLRAAVDWALGNQEVTSALQLVSSMQRFWFVRAHPNEGLEGLRAILGLPEAMRPSPARLKALNAYLFLVWPTGQLTEFQPLIEEALALGTTFGDRWNTAFALLWQGVSTTSQGDYSLARSQLERCLGIFQELQDTTYSVWAQVFLGDVTLLQGDPLRAQAWYEQAVPKLEETKDYPFLALPLRRLGQLAMSRGDLGKAKAFLDRSLADNWNLRDYRGVGASLAALGALSIAEERIERATELFGVVGTILESIRTLLLPFDQQQYDRNLAALRARIEPTTFVAAWAKGQAMSLDQAVIYALEDKTPN